MTRRIAALLAAAAILALPTQVQAHPLGQRPVAYIARDATGITFDWVIAPDEVQVLAKHLKLGPIRPEALAPSEPFVAYMRGRVSVTAEDEPCEMAPRVTGAQVSSGWSLRTRFECGAAPARVVVTVTMLHDVSKDYVTLWQAATDSGRARGAMTAARPIAVVAFTSTLRPAPTPTQRARPEGFSARVIDAMQTGAGVPLALIFALLLGALHALAPGHGKTIAAAVMVSGAGRRQAITLAGAVAGTHLFSVGVLSAIVIAAGRYSLPRGAQPVLQAVAGALALGIAYRIWRQSTRPHSDHHGAHEHPHPVGSRRSLLAGVVGGLVPSPGAVALALVAFASGRWVIGVLALALFSIGLGGVVLGVALLAARGRVLAASTSRRATMLAKIASAAIALSGIALLVTAIRR